MEIFGVKGFSWSASRAGDGVSSAIGVGLLESKSAGNANRIPIDFREGRKPRGGLRKGQGVEAP